MTDKQTRKQTFIELLILWVIGIIFLLFFSYMTSPLFPHSYGWDSAFFQLVGEGMTKGYLPYVDFFDMKGPWLFFIEYLAQLICYGRGGIFILQCVNLCVVSFLCHRIYRKHFSGKGVVGSIVMMLPFYLVLSSTMEGGNLTEEWSLLFLILPLYLALDFILNERREHKPLHGLIYGVCFGVLALIRITNTVMLCAIVLTITICLIKEKNWKNLLYNAGAFLLGVALAFVPPLLYFGYYGEIREMLYCVFVFGFIYGTEGYEIGTGGLFLLTLLFPVIVLILTGSKKGASGRRLWMLVIINTLGMAVTLGLGSSTMHDYILVIPGMMLGVWVLMENYTSCPQSPEGEASHFVSLLQKSGIHKLCICATVALCFLYPCYKMARAGLSILTSDHSETAHDIEMVAEYIPFGDENSVWGYEIPLRWYTITEIIPYSRYCGWQEHYMQLSEDVEAEILYMLEENPPKWIVTSTAKEIGHPGVRERVMNDYELYREFTDYRLYHLK